MTDVNVTVYCCLCGEKHEATVHLPDGWRYWGGIDAEEDGFCPQHALVETFAKSQCPGCVGGWGDCPMWDAFTVSRTRDIGPDDYACLDRGICPRRVNGTMIASWSSEIKQVDISTPAPSDAGKAFAQAIREYCERNP